MRHASHDNEDPFRSPFDSVPAQTPLHYPAQESVSPLCQPGHADPLALPSSAASEEAMRLFAGMYDDGPARAGDANEAAPLIPTAGMVARGELRGAPLLPRNALRAYADFGAEDFIGSDDLRLEQINRVTKQENEVLQTSMKQTLKSNGISDIKVGGRAKKPDSIYGKLLEKPGETIGNIKDISGTRVDINVNRPGFAQHYQVQEALQTGLGEKYTLGKNYIEHPNPWGYTGRMHDFYKGGNVPTHEVQIGSGDLSDFIDWKATSSGGETRSVHDMTGYKGDLYGTKIAPELETQYPQLMREIAANDRTGHTVAKSPELHTKISNFRGGVEAGLPAQFPEMPAPQVSSWTLLKRLAGRGLGGLGVIGGGLQAWQGAKEFQHGQSVAGLADVGGGLTNVGAGGAMLLGRAAAGSALGGVAAGVDGVKDIYLGVSNHRAEQAALGGVKTAAGGMMLAGTATANPLLIGAGALTYGGALAYEHRDALRKLASEGAHWMEHGAKGAWAGALDFGHRLAGSF